MFLRLAPRIVSHLGTSSAVRGITRARVSTTTSVVSPQTRRTFLTGTPRTSFPPAAADKKPSAKKSTAGKASKTKKTTTERKGVAAKKPVAKKTEKAKKPAKPTHPKLTKADMPPAQPGGPYVMFYTRFLKELPEQNRPTSSDELTSLAKQSGAKWKSMTEAEKQPFRDEAVAAAAAYQIRKKAYFESVPDSVLTEINRRRLAKGKNRVRKTVEREDRKPVTSFLRYANELRASPEGRNIIENHPSGLVASKEFVKIAAAKWRNMDASAKASYVEESARDFANYKAKKPAHV